MTEKQVEMVVKRKYTENKEEKKLKRKKKQLQKKKLIVRNLSFKVSKEELEKIFSVFGKVLNVEIPETKDGKKRGFAFVQFKDTKNQVKAMKELNFKNIHGRPIAIDFCVDKTTYQTKTNTSPSKSSNLDDSTKVDEDSDDDDGDDNDKDATSKTVESNSNSASEEEIDEKEKELNDFFKKFDGDVEMHDTDNSSGETDNESEPNESEEEIDDKSSMKDEQPMKRKHSEDLSQGKTVFIRNISFNNTEEDLKSLAEEYGDVDYCLFCMDRLTDQFKGSAFVKFKEKESADNLIQESNKEPGIFLQGRKLYCVYAITKDDLSKQQSGSDKVKDKRNLRLLKCGVIMEDSGEAEGVSQTDMAKRAQLEMEKKRKLKNVNFFVSDKRLAVHNLPKNINDKGLRILFKKAAGKDAVITEARVMKDFKKTDGKGNPISRGFGFVSFTEHEHALKALTELNNNPSTFVPNKRPIVEFSIENKVALLSQEKRRKNLEMLNKKRLEVKPQTEEKPSIFKLKRKQQHNDEFNSRKQQNTNKFHSRKKVESKARQRKGPAAETDKKSKKSKKRQKKHLKGKERGIQVNAQERRNLSTLTNKYKEKLLNKFS